MKKLISVMLAVLLTVSMFTCLAYAEGEEWDVSFAVASDLHYALPEETLTWYSEDPVFGYANRRAAMDNESGLIIDEFLRQCAENPEIQFVLISGDLTDEGKVYPEEHAAVSAKLKAFEIATGKDVFVIPGNHDYSIKNEVINTDRDVFYSYYKDFGYDKAIDRIENDLSYTADLGDKYRLIALDSCDPTKSTEDGMTDAKVQWVIDMAEKAKEDGRHPILMMHHNLLDHLPMQRVLSHDFIIRNHEATATKWADAGIKVVFTGHEHCSDATSKTTVSGNVITDFATTALTMYPLQYRIIKMNDAAISYDVGTVDSIDTAALSLMVDGYTPQQLDLMNQGLNAFAKQYLKNGVEYRLERGFNDEQLGIEEGDIYYGLVRDVVDALNDLLNQPLYGKNSVQEYAKQYDIEIPDSDYVDGWDVATELVAAHYAGSENYPLSDRDVTIFLRLVALVIRSEFNTIDNSILIQAAYAIVGAFGSYYATFKIIDEFFPDAQGITGAEYFAVALVSPLLRSFTEDDGIDDNVGTLEGYGETDSTGNITSSLSEFFSNMLANLKNFFNYILKSMGIKI